MSLVTNPFIPEILTPEEVARILRVERRTVLAYARQKKLRSIKMGRLVRFHRDDVAAFIDGLRS